MNDFTQEDEEFLSAVVGFGLDFNLTQGLGGNCSIKSNGTMLVKASGKRLFSVREPGYFYRLSLMGHEHVDNISNQSGKPSIEAFLHALLGYRYVLHLHSTRAVALGLISDQQTLKVFDESGIRLAYVPYVKPGEELREAIVTHPMFPAANAYLLVNHGIVLGSDSAAEIASLVSGFETVAGALLPHDESPGLTPANLEQRLSREESSRVHWHAIANWPISPDHVLFLGHEAGLDFLERLSSARTTAELLRLQRDDELSIADEQKLWFYNVARLLPQISLPQLKHEEVEEIRNWDLEKHRQASLGLEQ